MKEEYTKYYCDLCKKEVTDEDCFKSVPYPVIFLTNQIDGASSKPYLDVLHLDICRSCADKVLKVTAQGCQGVNSYQIRKEEGEEK